MPLLTTWADCAPGLFRYRCDKKLVHYRFAMDAAAEACINGQLKQFSGDLAHYKVSCMFMSFSAQTVPGDQLDIYIWEDMNIDRRLHCQIQLKDQAVYNTVIDFHDPAHLEKLASENSKL